MTHIEQLTQIIFETMKSEQTSLLQAQGVVMRLVSSDEVTKAVIEKVNEYNGVKG